ncbi:Retrovirus-related Pol polyprotein from transposon TNT 1-94 [Senna tora]|uniref:Retrovirus-related Pol polyprotein from transposon TNT 1-94 n=1 Tax=Senna tora TaxID=362788 RepID=A0A835CCW9_9FABA|nr:Retrovirus-related Pol polyprotein from transposon TNT 1-94 [Senna tora]
MIRSTSTPREFVKSHNCIPHTSTIHILIGVLPFRRGDKFSFTCRFFCYICLPRALLKEPNSGPCQGTFTCSCLPPSIFNLGPSSIPSELRLLLSLRKYVGIGFATQFESFLHQPPSEVASHSGHLLVLGISVAPTIEHVYSILDMHEVANALAEFEPTADAAKPTKDFLLHANKVCRHTLISTMSNDMFDIYSVYKEANKIWESLILKYIVEDAGKQKFIVGNYYKWEMIDDKDIKLLPKELRAEKINLSDEFVAEILIEKLPEFALAANPHRLDHSHHY